MTICMGDVNTRKLVDKACYSSVPAEMGCELSGQVLRHCHDCQVGNKRT